MGTAPLPYDDRPACWVHQNCPLYYQPERRYWMRIKGAAPDIPELEAGVLLEWIGGPGPTAHGQWGYLGPAIPNFFGGFLFMGPLSPIPSDNRYLIAQAGTLFGSWVQEINYHATSCGWRTWRLLDPASAPPGWTECCILAVRWYEDADVVLAGSASLCLF